MTKHQVLIELTEREREGYLLNRGDLPRVIEIQLMEGGLRRDEGGRTWFARTFESIEVSLVDVEHVGIEGQPGGIER